MEYVVSKDYKTGEKILGRIAYSNLQECFNKVQPGDRIYLRNESYYGKVILRCPDITLIGMDESVITYDAYHSEKIRECDGGDGVKVYGTTGSATFTLSPMASNFRMFNVTVQNTHKHEAESGNQAVAFKTNAQGGYYEECKFIGCQDTLYIASIENVVNRCFISGTVDFIFGPGTAIFDHCSLIVRANEAKLAYICAPSSHAENSYGLYFYKCNVSVIKGSAYRNLGRPWWDSGSKYTLIPRAFYYECQFPSDIEISFCKMRETDPDNYEMYYYNCTQNGKTVGNLDDMKIVDFYEKIYQQRR